ADGPESVGIFLHGCHSRYPATAPGEAAPVTSLRSPARFLLPGRLSRRDHSLAALRNRALARTLLVPLQYLIFQHVRGLESQDLARKDRHFLTGLGVAADALVLGANLE